MSEGPQLNIHLNDIWHRLGVTEAQNRELLRMVSELRDSAEKKATANEVRLRKVEDAINFVKYGSIAVAGFFTLVFNSVGEFLKHIK